MSPKAKRILRETLSDVSITAAAIVVGDAVIHGVHHAKGTFVVLSRGVVLAAVLTTAVQWIADRGR